MKYPIYPKNSPKARDFRKAFAAAYNAGEYVFKWEGREYTTELKEKA